MTSSASLEDDRPVGARGRRQRNPDDPLPVSVRVRSRATPSPGAVRPGLQEAESPRLSASEGGRLALDSSRPNRSVRSWNGRPEHEGGRLYWRPTVRLGNTDVALLPVSAIDLKAGFLDYPRPKTAISERIPLWPETVAAIRSLLSEATRARRTRRRRTASHRPTWGKLHRQSQGLSSAPRNSSGCANEGRGRRAARSTTCAGRFRRSAKKPGISLPCRASWAMPRPVVICLRSIDKG